jgi:hypothetical protein
LAAHVVVEHAKICLCLSVENKMIIQIRIGRGLRTSISFAVIVLGCAAFFQEMDLAAARQSVPQQMTFASPTDGVAALVDAVRNKDDRKLEALLGPGSRDVINSGDAVADQLTRDRFLAAYDMKSTLVPLNAIAASLRVGDDDWPFPIPLVKDDGIWRFDLAAGREEILNRRIGRNEANAIEASLAFVDAQRDYASVDRDGDGVLEYAQRFVSTNGMKDGLYWQVQGNEPPSPLGPAFAAARAEGFGLEAPNAKANASVSGQAPYYGYYYKLLTSQGPAAMPGGAYDYLVNGNLLGGFALIAYPASYGVSGVMTFIVNHDGAVYESDLGSDTVRTVVGIAAFNPDDKWQRVEN